VLFLYVKKGVKMNFSVVQQKEIIDIKTGKSLGYIMDAFVNNDTGEIEYFVVEQPRKFYDVFTKESNVKKVYFKQIKAFGADVILIQLQE
jgi:YlmC/YmxH family sporulation protein